MIPTKATLTVNTEEADLENEDIVAGWLHDTMEANYRELEPRAIDTLPLPLEIGDIEFALDEHNLMALDYIAIHPHEVLTNLPDAQWWSQENPERYLPEPGDMDITGNSGMLMVAGRPLLIYVTERIPPNLVVMLSRDDIQVFDLHS